MLFLMLRDAFLDACIYIVLRNCQMTKLTLKQSPIGLDNTERFIIYIQYVNAFATRHLARAQRAIF